MADLRDHLARLRAIEKEATPGPWRPTHSPAVEGKPWIEAGQNGYDEVLGPSDVSCMSYCLGGSSRCEMTTEDMMAITTARNLFPLLLDVAEAAENVCDGATCELEDERLRYETWQHPVGAVRALREALAKLGEADRG